MAVIRVLCEPFKPNSNGISYWPFNGIQAIKIYRKYTKYGLAEAKHWLLDEPMKPNQKNNTILFESADIKTAINLYRELKEIKVPVIIEGLTPAARILYGF